jgi:protein-tyrosine-phosphatase/tRNA A37 threonylcarbamoyladenosine synthetase subunit TsaC/SUA5/YrdC
MPDVVRLSPSGHSAAEVRKIAGSVIAGKVVVLPSECGYLRVCSPLLGPAVERWSETCGRSDVTLHLAHPDSARDFVPRAAWSHATDRIIRRCWPGPVWLQFPSESTDTLLEYLSPPARTLVSASATINLACSGHAVLQGIADDLPWPLLVERRNRQSDGKPPQQFDDALAVWGDAADVIVDAGNVRYSDHATIARVHESGGQVVEEGIVGARTIQQLSSQIILFVCTGNTCRSPMAEAMFRNLLAEKLHCGEQDVASRGVVVLSAGLATTPGMPASEHSVELMREAGIDLTGHQSQSASPELLGVADLVVTMTRSHRESILQRFPELSGRVRLLAPGERDVFDPFGGTRYDYERCRDEIRGHLSALVDHVIQDVCGQNLP